MGTAPSPPTRRERGSARQAQLQNDGVTENRVGTVDGRQLPAGSAPGPPLLPTLLKKRKLLLFYQKLVIMRLDPSKGPSRPELCSDSRLIFESWSAFCALPQFGSHRNTDPWRLP